MATARPTILSEIVVPVVLTSVEGSIQLAESMEARGFGSGPRTAVKSARLQRTDWLVIGASAAALAIFVISQAVGWAAPWFAYPTLSWPSIDPRPLAACLLLLTPVTVWRSRN